MTEQQHHSPSATSLFSEHSGPSEAPLVVLIHGSLDRSAGMTKLARQIHHDFLTLRYDRRGYGKSWEHKGPYAVADQVDDLEKLLDGRNALLFGHSYGGNIALAAAERLGAQINGVSTFETPLSWMPWWPGTTAGSLGISAGTDLAAEKFMIRLIGQKRWDDLPERTKTERRREGAALVGELGLLRVSEPWNAANIHCRVLCGFGTRGLEHHRQGAQWLVDNLNDSELVAIEGAGHGAPMSHSLQCATQLIFPHFEGTGTRTLMS